MDIIVSFPKFCEKLLAKFHSNRAIGCLVIAKKRFLKWWPYAVLNLKKILVLVLADDGLRSSLNFKCPIPRRVGSWRNLQCLLRLRVSVDYSNLIQLSGWRNYVFNRVPVIASLKQCPLYRSRWNIYMEKVFWPDVFSSVNKKYVLIKSPRSLLVRNVG